jgi:CRP-like cAMP-binding protein
MQQNKIRISALRVLLHSPGCREKSTDMRKIILPVGGKFMEHITLFTDILPEEQERMRVCFKVREKVFQNGETIMEYSSSMKKIGLIQEGRAVLYCCDEDGNEYVIDELNKDSVFGEPFLLPSDSQHYYVCATTVTKVLFIDYEHVIKRCENACHPDGQ